MRTEEATMGTGQFALATGAATLLLVCLGMIVAAPDFSVLYLAPILGTVALVLWQYAITGRWPSLTQTLQDVAALFLLTSARDDAVKIWQLPLAWRDLLQITPAGVTISCAAYFVASLSAMLWANRHLVLLERVAIVLMPFAFNLVLALGATPLMHQIGSSALLGLSAPDSLAIALGRALLLFVLGQLLVALLAATMTGRVLRDKRFHLLLVLSTVHAALTPIIADLPSQWTGSSAGLAQFLGAVACAALAQAGLWAVVFLATGILIDALLGKPPTFPAARKHWQGGLVKGSIYGGLFMFILLAARAVILNPEINHFLVHYPVLSAALAGALLYPLASTIVASADETPPFFGRLLDNYQQPASYLRGLVVGAGIAWALSSGLPREEGLHRFLAMFVIGALAYAGVDFIVDLAHVMSGERRKLRIWRVYGLGAALGGLVAGALGWYLDAEQIAVVSRKFWDYTDLNYVSSGRTISNYTINALFNKWGSADLGPYGGGVRLFYDESLSGVINWSIAAPLFSVNYFVLAALMRRSLRPLKELFSAKGIEGLVEQAVRVMRWGLWMAPIIFSFLRKSPDPSWYNQDGAVHTVAATIFDIVLPPGDFRNWSLTIFTGLLAYDWLRVVIWFDHMGLRVATLVNLSFLGGDRADEAAARFAGHPARTRFIPEGIRRFATWAPLLIPFYLPAPGPEWDTAWTGAERIRATAPPLPSSVVSLVIAYIIAAICGGLIAALVVRGARETRAAAGPPMPGVPRCLGARRQRIRISNGFIAFELLPDGRGYTHIHATARKGGAIDITRRPNDPLQLRGPFFYVREKGVGRPWSIGFQPSQIAGSDYDFARLSPGHLQISNTVDDLTATFEVVLSEDDCVAVQQIRLTNRLDRPRHVVLTSFQELALHEPAAYTRDPEFNGMHVETTFVPPLNAVLARNRLLRNGARKQEDRRMSREMAFHAVKAKSAVQLVGYEDSRTRFIGSGSLRLPEGLAEGRPRSPSDDGKLYSFDPAASLTITVELGPNESNEIVFVTGYARNEISAASLISKYTGSRPINEATLVETLEKRRLLEPKALPSAQSWPFTLSPTELRLTHKTPRPWAHLMANPLGYGAVVSNEGEIYSFAGNARHNGLTPFSFDTVAVPVPGQLIYVVDLESGEAETAGFVPFRRTDAEHNVVYDLGTATFEKTRRDLRLALTVFVLPDEPADIRLLTIANRANKARRFRVVPYFDMALDESPQDSLAWLETDFDKAANALLFFNPHNDFRRGWAFASTSLSADLVEIVRARFVGEEGRDLTNAVMVETGRPDGSRKDDQRRIAAFSHEVEVAAGGETTIVVVLGQAKTREQAVALAARLRQPEIARAALQTTRDWWLNRIDAVHVTTNNAAFDRLVNYWLPYQLLASRLWGRTGPNQRGGAFGFRDQLQDVLPLVFHDASLTRRQILLHAAQQFPEGDVLKWWHSAPGGGTGLGQRTRASDPHLWLPYVVLRYVTATGDNQILAELIPYLDAPAVPKGTDTLLVAPRRSLEVGDLYDHCRRAIDYTLEHISARGLPLMRAGDWNDGLDLVGFKDRGESVWLAFFLHDVLSGFAQNLARDEADGSRYRTAAEKLRSALEIAWRGDHYVLAFADSGVPLKQMSAMTAVWPILSGAVDYERGKAALERGLMALERGDRILLLTPPFDERSDPYPGRIADYPAGVRENGGQYSHGVSWSVDAFVRLAELAHCRGDEEAAAQHIRLAFDCWSKISPIGKTDGAKLAVYGLAPHQQPADIYDGLGHDGRGGWSWYTGSAARMLSAAYAVLGLKMKDGRIIIADNVLAPKGDLLVKSIRCGSQTIAVPQKAEVRDSEKVGVTDAVSCIDCDGMSPGTKPGGANVTT
jgi:cyclic beta-1,2-glucan synthetase